MNTPKTAQHTKSTPSTLAPSATRRPPHRTRDFGVGYGSSSGYASERRYTSDWGQMRFRMA